MEQFVIGNFPRINTVLKSELCLELRSSITVKINLKVEDNYKIFKCTMIRNCVFWVLVVSVNSIVFDDVLNCTDFVLNGLNVQTILFIQMNVSALPSDLLSGYIPKLILNLAEDFHLSKYLKVDVYVSVINYPEEFGEIIRRVYRKFHPSTKYILVLTRSFTIEDLKIVFNTGLKYRVINVVVICNDLNIYTFYPYENGGCGKNTEVERVGECYKPGEWFPSKTPLYFPGCQIRMLPLKVLPYVIDIGREEKPGLEISLVREFVSRMEITPVWIEHNHTSFGFKQKGLSDIDTTYIGMFQTMWLDQADLMFGMLRMNQSYVNDFEFTKTHTMDKLTWHVSTAQEIKKWKNVTLIFTLGMWISLGVVVPLNALIWLVLSRNKDRYRNSWKCYSRTLYTLLQGSVDKPVSDPLRLAFMGWILGGLLLSTAYQSKLISLLTKTLYEPQVETVKDIIDKGLKFGFFSSLNDLFDNPDDPVDSFIYNNYVLCPFTGLECINRAAYRHDFAVLKNRRQIRYLSPNYTYSNGRSRLYSFDLDVFYYPLSMIMLKGHPLLPRIDALMLRMAECGFMNKFDDDLGLDHDLIYVDDTTAKPLTLDHLTGIFILYWVGMALAGVSLLFEILYKFMISFWGKHNKKG